MLDTLAGPVESLFRALGLVYARAVSVGSLPQHALRSPLSGGRRALGAGSFAGPGGAPVLLALAGLMGVAAGLRFYGIGHQGFWFDEANTAQLVRFSPGKMLGLHPPERVHASAVLLRGLGVGARSSATARPGCARCRRWPACCVVPVAYGRGARLIGRRAGLIAAALTACNPLLIWYSQEARSYSMLVLLSAVSLARVRVRARRPHPACPHVVGAGLAAWRWPPTTSPPSSSCPRRSWLAGRAPGPPARSRSPWRSSPPAGSCSFPLAISQNGTGHDSWIATVPLGARAAARSSPSS